MPSAIFIFNVQYKISMLSFASSRWLFHVINSSILSTLSLTNKLLNMFGIVCTRCAIPHPEIARLLCSRPPYFLAVIKPWGNDKTRGKNILVYLGRPVILSTWFVSYKLLPLITHKPTDIPPKMCHKSIQSLSISPEVRTFPTWPKTLQNFDLKKTRIESMKILLL